MRSAFGVDHGEVSKSIGLPKGLRAAKGVGGYASNLPGNRKSAHYVGRILARSKARGVDIDPHVGQKYRSKSRELTEHAIKSGPKKKRVLP